MVTRLGSLNLENLFDRVRAMNLGSWNEGKVILDEYAQLNKRLQKPVYSSSDKKSIVESLMRLGLAKSDESKFVTLRKNRGEFIKRSKSAPPVVVAEGRNDWIGWLELTTEAVDEIATKMTARVIKDVNADILAVIEAENRIALKNFNKQLLKPINAEYGCIMLIDGNDERGIDVGVLAKQQFCLESIISHVDDSEDGKVIFSRDCPEFYLSDTHGNNILLLVNHLKSKGFGNQADSNKKRKLQAERVRKIYEMRKEQGIEMIAIAGDFNDTPDSDPLKPLLGDGSDLKDIFGHPNFNDEGRPGTFGNCTKSQKIDYLLLSPKLYEKIIAGGVWRKGIWAGKNGDIFPHYDEMKKPAHAASDHAAVWVDLELN